MMQKETMPLRETKTHHSPEQHHEAEEQQQEREKPAVTMASMHLAVSYPTERKRALRRGHP
jgi:hypothetical protein